MQNRPITACTRVDPICTPPNELHIESIDQAMASLATESVVDAGIHTEIQVMVTEDYLCLFPVSSSRPETPKSAIVFDRSNQSMVIEGTIL
jgi:hypothetical protein